MESIDERAPRAESLWARGEIAESAGDLAAAYALFTQAHDLVVDCARLHRRGPCLVVSGEAGCRAVSLWTLGIEH